MKSGREMPDAYVEYGTPLISKRTAPINNIEESEFYVGKETGVNYFCITFFYDKNNPKHTEIFLEDFAANIYIWEDPVFPFSIDFGDSEGWSKELWKRPVKK